LDDTDKGNKTDDDNSGMLLESILENEWVRAAGVIAALA
jgi:hypothetical protein